MTKKKCYHANKEIVRKGRLKQDPDYPDDPKMRVRLLTWRCPACGKHWTSEEYPYMLSDLFEVPKK